MLLGRFGSLPYKITAWPLTWKNKVREFQSGSGKVTEMSAKTVLGLPIRQNWWYQFFSARFARLLFCPTFSNGDATLGWNQLLVLDGGLLPSLPAGVSLNLCLHTLLEKSKFYVLWKVVTKEKRGGGGLKYEMKKRGPPLHMFWPPCLPHS